ncbi:MAG: DUF945 domain-containing protein [Gammaproteobacteria bacterium]|nr:DUF945 domain-containing protein [Gammaproteobacteria bacterium]
MLSRTILQPARALSLDEVQRAAPSIFAETPHAKLSGRYTLIPTGKVLEALHHEGFVPTRVMQTRIRNESGIGTAKHLVRLRHRDQLDRPATVDAIVPEVVLVNSHDGSSSYQLHAGLYRFVCSNGMVVADGCIGSLSIRHAGNVVDEVIEGVYEIVKETPRLIERVADYRATSVSDREARVLAGAALDLKYEPDKAPIGPDQLIVPRRAEDHGTDLWSRMNVVQENLLRGGLRGQSANGRRLRTRAVASVSDDVRLNKALWRLTEEFARLKAAH